MGAIFPELLHMITVWAFIVEISFARYKTLIFSPLAYLKYVTVFSFGLKHYCQKD